MNYKKQLKSRYILILSYIGIAFLIIGVTLLLPILSIPFNLEEASLTKYFIISASISIIAGIAIRKVCKEANTNIRLSLSEAGIIIVVSWLLAIAFSSLTFFISGQLELNQAIFEAVSGWTTTGLTVIDVDNTPKVFLMLRSVMQFFGGAGFSIIMLSAIIGPSGIGMRSIEGKDNKILPTIGKSTKIFFTIYLGYFIFGTIAYIIAGMPFFDSLNHSMTAVSTGGFSVSSSSIGGYNSVGIEIVTIVLMLIGSINFASHYILLKGKVKEFFKVDELRLLVKLIFAGCIIAVLLLANSNIATSLNPLRKSAFQLVSALSTSGFATTGYEAWPSSILFIIVIFMIIGGGIGSTSGGIKLYRLNVILKSLLYNIKSFLRPGTLIDTNLIYNVKGKQRVSNWHGLEAANYIIVFLITFTLGVFIFLLHGFPLDKSIYEFASCLGTVGLTSGITSASAPTGILWTQIIGMILGRLEFFIVFFAISKFIQDFKFAFNKKKD